MSSHPYNDSCCFFPVPARNGTESFALQKIEQLVTYTHELAEGTPVFITFTVSWYEWDGKDGEGLTQKNDGSPSKMKAAGFVNAVLFNLQEVVVLYDPYPIEDEESSNDSASDVFV